MSARGYKKSSARKALCGREKANPALVELRQPRIVLARLVVRYGCRWASSQRRRMRRHGLQRRGLRGVYGGAA
jgi:hypothetical protein